MKHIFKKMTSPSAIKPELQKVLITTKELVATDAYKMLVVKPESLSKDDAFIFALLEKKLGKKKSGLFDLKYEKLSDDEVFSAVKLGDSEKYPDFKRAMPTEKDLVDDDLYASVTVDPRHLMELAQAIANTYHKEDKKFPSVVLKIRKDALGKNKPIVLERKDKLAIGVLMPRND